MDQATVRRAEPVTRSELLLGAATARVALRIGRVEVLVRRLRLLDVAVVGGWPGVAAPFSCHSAPPCCKETETVTTTTALTARIWRRPATLQGQGQRTCANRRTCGGPTIAYNDWARITSPCVTHRCVEVAVAVVTG